MDWKDDFDERELKEIELCVIYAERFNHGTLGHNIRNIVAKLVSFLDSPQAILDNPQVIVSDEKAQSTTLQEAYYDRNLAVMALARMARSCGFRVGFRTDPDEPDWPVLFVDLPTGQVSWHLPRTDVIGKWNEYADRWDRHTLGEKQGRVIRFIEHSE